MNNIYFAKGAESAKSPPKGWYKYRIYFLFYVRS